MADMPAVFEGTWEELATHADELSGKRLRVILVADASKLGAKAAPEEDLETLLAPYIGVVSFDPPDLSEKAEEYYGKFITEKYWRQQQPQ